MDPTTSTFTGAANAPPVQEEFGSVCSGIEAASVAWEELGWRAAWFAEIDNFPRALLKHHYPDTSNYGDMTTLPALILAGKVSAPGIFCGGTPCQSYSLAGLRRSLDDERGNLTLTYCKIADAIDTARAIRGLPPAIDFWENVPGVLSTADNAFGCFLAGLAGADDALEPEPRPAAGKSSRFWRWNKKTSQHAPSWPDAGCVLGPTRAVAWRVLDAQFFGLAQRRRRVFVVASAREGFDPAAVLFEFDGVRRDTAPSREAAQGSAAGTLRSSDGGCDLDHARAGHLTTAALDANYGKLFGCSGQDANHGHSTLVAFGGNNTAGPIDVATARNACASASGRMDFESETFLVETAGALCRDSFTGDVAATLGTKSGDGLSSGPSVMQSMQVRRLTPVECERLQGFPDGYTAIPYRKKPASVCPDGPRYKALGNSWATNCVRWIGRRIAAELKRCA